MTATTILDLTYEALMLVLMLSLPAVLAAALVGLLIAVLQAVTQIQDQSIGLAGKLIVVIVTLTLTARWAGGELYNFGDKLFNAFPTLH